MGIYNILRLSINPYNILGLSINPYLIPIDPERDLWVKINPHKSPFPINLTSPEIQTQSTLLEKDRIAHDFETWS